MTKVYQDIARVSALYRYPVKSMAGEAVDDVKVGWHGLAGDRRFAFLRATDKTGLPWLSAREFPRLILYTARFADPVAADGGQVLVTTPGGKQLHLHDTVLREEIGQMVGEPIQLVHLWRVTFDSMAFSLISTSSIATISAIVGCQLEQERFRPNVVVEVFEDRAYPEDR